MTIRKSTIHDLPSILQLIEDGRQKMISEGLDVPLAEIYGIVTFYTQFSLNPKGKYQIGVCLGTACYVKGSGDILEKIKEILKIDVGEYHGQMRRVLKHHLF